MSQIELMTNLENIMMKVKEGKSITDSQFGMVGTENEESGYSLEKVKALYPLRKYLKAFNTYRIDLHNF